MSNVGQVWELYPTRSSGPVILLLIEEPRVANDQGNRYQAAFTIASAAPDYYPENKVGDWDARWFEQEDSESRRLA